MKTKTKVVAIPKGTESKLALAKTVINALTAHPEAVTTPGLAAAVTADTAATHQAFNVVGEGEATVAAARETRRQAYKKLKKATRSYMSLFRSLLTGRWTPEWGVMNMRPGRLRTPTTADDQLAFVFQVSLYLQAHPELESEGLNFTAAQATALHTEVTDARSAVLDAELELTLRKEALERTEATLTTTLMMVRTALRLLGPDNPMWATFGFRIPSNPRTPEQVTGVEITNVSPGVIRVTWDLAPRATFYRVFLKGSGEGAELQAVARVEGGGTEALVDSLEAGAAYLIVVRAGNETAEGVGSEPISIVA